MIHREPGQSLLCPYHFLASLVRRRPTDPFCELVRAEYPHCAAAIVYTRKVGLRAGGVLRVHRSGVTSTAISTPARNAGRKRRSPSPNQDSPLGGNLARWASSFEWPILHRSCSLVHTVPQDITRSQIRYGPDRFKCLFLEPAWA